MKRSKYLVLVLVILVFTSLAWSGCLGEDSPPGVTVDGNALDFAVEPEVENGILLVPGYDLFLALYGEPSWDAESQTLGINDYNLIFLFQAGNNIANVNNQPYELTAIPRMKENQLLVPLNLVVEVLGYRMAADNSVTTIWTDASQVGTSDAQRLLVGLWSDTEYYGEMYDYATGMPVDSAYSGQWYLFRADGTFRYVIIGSGQIISGIVVQEGKYKVEGQELVLYKIKASWYPDPSHSNQSPPYEDKADDDERLTLTLDSDPNNIQLNGNTFFYNP